jgi:hypothetical protein
LINPHRPDCSMDGMDSISPSRHKPPPVSTQIRHDPLAVSRSQAQRTLFGKLIPEPMHVTVVKGRKQTGSRCNYKAAVALQCPVTNR